MRSTFKRPVEIHSAYRCVKHNNRVGGSKNSFHTKGFAVDFSFDGTLGILDVFPTLVDIFNRVGVYANKKTHNGFFHVDDMSTHLYWLCDVTSGHKYRYYHSPEDLLNYATRIAEFDWKKVRV